MREGWKDLDRLLRGDATRPRALQSGEVSISTGPLLAVLVVLAMAYGASMGSFAMLKEGGPEWRQCVSGAVKVPVLLLATVAVTLPSLYVFSALIGSRLTVDAVLRLLIASLAVMVAVLASLGPIVAFFSLSTTNYPFMVLLNVLVFAASGVMGLTFMIQTLQKLGRIAAESEGRSIEVVGPEGEARPASTGESDRRIRTVFRCWIVLFALVGSQMGWVLRPFIGNPTLLFAWLRGRDSNVFVAIWHHIADVF